jgi:hypothetical protein
MQTHACGSSSFVAYFLHDQGEIRMQFDPDAPEQLDREQLAVLKARLELIGPWTYARGTGGIHRAERGGTLKHEQAALTADGLVEAVEQREQQIAERDHVAQVHTGLSGTND